MIEPVNVGGNINDAKIIFIGEKHNVDWIYDVEFEKWKQYYVNERLRHLFMEMPYYFAQTFNLWMKSDVSDISIMGSMNNDQNAYKFYKKIKSECPETIFHGNDVGHDYKYINERSLNYYMENVFKNIEQYNIILEIIEQGRNYYENYSEEEEKEEYRENMMVRNFIREFDNLENKKVIGIYGGAHTNYNRNFGNFKYPCMAKQLYEYYGNIIYFENYWEHEN
ncbi:MAG: hypothetical protein LBB81_02450 [Treponema sp.]|jgi:hypothetical protein|nr:hypothetical protein [Treponema sp.]